MLLTLKIFAVTAIATFFGGGKLGDHTHLFDAVTDADKNGNLHRVTTKHLDKKGTWTKKDRRAKRGGSKRCRSTQATSTCWSTSLSIPNSIAKQRFNCEATITKRFSWVTDLSVDASQVRLLVRAGRSRWRIENETFNTLKNQGYHFEHKAKGSWKYPNPLRKRGTKC